MGFHSSLQRGAALHYPTLNRLKADRKSSVTGHRVGLGALRHGSPNSWLNRNNGEGKCRCDETVHPPKNRERAGSGGTLESSSECTRYPAHCQSLETSFDLFVLIREGSFACDPVTRFCHRCGIVTRRLREQSSPLRTACSQPCVRLFVCLVRAKHVTLTWPSDHNGTRMPLCGSGSMRDMSATRGVPSNGAAC